MSSLDKSLESKFNDLKIAINQDKGKWPSAQGVNALIMVYPPKKERECLKRVKEDYGSEYIIDLSKIFIENEIIPIYSGFFAITTSSLFLPRR